LAVASSGAAESMLTIRDIANTGPRAGACCGRHGRRQPDPLGPSPARIRRPARGGGLPITTGLGIGELSRPHRGTCAGWRPRPRRARVRRRLRLGGAAGRARGRASSSTSRSPSRTRCRSSLTKAISSRLANAQLARLEARSGASGSRTPCSGRGAPALWRSWGIPSAALCSSAGGPCRRRRHRNSTTATCSAAGRADGETWSLRAGKPQDELSVRPLSASTASQRSPSALTATQSRPPSFGSRATSRPQATGSTGRDRARIAAFGLDPQDRYAALLAVAVGAAGDDVPPRRPNARARGARYLFTNFASTRSSSGRCGCAVRQGSWSRPHRGPRVIVGRPRRDPDSAAACSGARPRRGRRAGRLLSGSRLPRGYC
jgi:hypothetical protein